MSTPRKHGYGGVEFIDVDESTATTSGSGMTERKRSAPLPDARAAGKLDFDFQIAPAEEWARDVVKRAGLKPDGKVNGAADTPENYAQRFLDYGREIRASIGRGDAAGAAAQALVLGGFIRESQLKFKWETHVERYEKYRKIQSDKASKPRGEKSDDGTTANDLIQQLALRKDSIGDHLPVVELWNEFQGDLDGKGLQLNMEFKRFQNAIADARRKSR